MRIPSVILAVCLAQFAAAQPTETTAEKLIAAGHWKQARTLVEARLRQSPDEALSTFLLSQIRNSFGDYTSPLTLAEKAVALDGRVAKYHRQLAEVLGVEAQHANPVKIVFLAHRFRTEIDIATSLDPRDLQAQRDLLEYYLVAPGIAGGDIQKASVTAQYIAQLDAAEGLLARARIAAVRRQDAETENLLRQATQAQPPSYRARVELANFYLTDRPSQTSAESVAKDLLNLDRNRVEPYSILARIYAERADWNALDAVLADASREVPDDLAPCYRAAEALIANRRDPGRAERYLRLYLDHEPEGNEPSLADAQRKLSECRKKSL